MSIRAWIFNPFILTLQIEFERQSGKAADIVIGDTVVAEQFFSEEADRQTFEKCPRLPHL